MTISRKRVVWSVTAREDARNVWRYHAHVASVEVADRLYSELISMVARIAENPRLWRVRNEIAANLRGAVVRPYAIFFREYGSRIQIVRIIHGRRNIPAFFRKRQEGKR